MTNFGSSPFKIEDHALKSSDGESSIFLRTYSKGTPKIHFLIVHGALEHSGRHMDLIQFWIKQYSDVVVSVFDFVGHGKSGGTRAFVESFKNYVDDFTLVVDKISSLNLETTKIFICAHSLGGLVTLTRLLDFSHPLKSHIHGVIFSSPCIRPLNFLGPLLMPGLVKLNALTPKFHLPMIYSGINLTRDPERANDFDTDPLIPKFICVRMVKELMEAGKKIIGLSYYLKVPSLFLVAGSDKIVDSNSTLLFAHGIDKQLCDVVQYPQHCHELWNEIDRQDIFKTMKNWVDKRI